MKEHLKDYHYFASSFCTWITTTPERSLAEVIRYMDKEKNSYSIFRVPRKWDHSYAIEWYVPQVEGTEFIETIEVKRK